MMSNHYDLTIAYRIYPKVSKVPPIFPDDKLKLSEICLSSFKESLSGLKIKFIAILDNCPDVYKRLFKKYFTEDELEIIETQGIGNAETFKLQMKILSGQNYSQNIYFAEDDYFYLENEKIKNLVELLSQGDVDFITPYFHLDYTWMKPHLEFESETKILNTKEYQTVSTTTMTFLTNKETLKRTKDIFYTYTKRNDDASLWLTLTKHRVHNPFLPLIYFFKDKLWFKMYAKTWYFTALNNLLGRKYKLWVPNISYATHMDNQCLAPNIAWQKHFKLQSKKINFVT